MGMRCDLLQVTAEFSLDFVNICSDRMHHVLSHQVYLFKGVLQIIGQCEEIIVLTWFVAETANEVGMLTVYRG